jgi:hypothetical protein
MFRHDDSSAKSYAPCSKQHASHHEVQTHELVNKVKRLSVLSTKVICGFSEYEHFYSKNMFAGYPQG